MRDINKDRYDRPFRHHERCQGRGWQIVEQPSLVYAVQTARN
jgi:hypothetical protein